MPDITQPMQLAESTPQDAANNIDGSNLFNVGADVFKDYKNELQPEADRLSVPSQAPPGVARYVAQSSEHAALAAPDIKNLSTMERQFNRLDEIVNKRPAVEDQITEIALRKVFNKDKVTENDNLQLEILNEQQKEFNNYGVEGFWEQLPGDVLGGIAGIGTTLSKNKALIASGTSAGALIGLGGSMATGPFALATAGPAALAGATTGFVNSSIAALAIDGTDKAIGSTYNELNKMRMTNGEPIDEDTKRYLSMGVGTATGVIVAVVGKSVASGIPILSKLINPSSLKTVVVDPANAVMKQALANIGKAVLEGGAGNTAQEASKILAEEFAKTSDGSEASYLNALVVSSDRLKKAAVVGAATTGVLSTAGQALSYKSAKSSYISAEEFKFNNARDVGGANEATPTNLLPQKPSGGGGAAKTPVEKAVDILNFEDVTTDITKVANATGMKKISPAQLTSVIKQMVDSTGVKKIFVDKEDLQKFSSDPVKGKAVRDIIDPSGVAAASMNAPIAIDTHKFLELQAEYPDLSGIAKTSPEGPNAEQARKYMQELEDSHIQRRDVLTKLQTPDMTPEEVALHTETLNKALQIDQVSHDVFGEEEYLKQPTFTKAIEGVLTENEVKTFNEAQLKARTMVSDNIQEAARLEMDQVRDVVTEQAKQAQYEIERDKIAKDPNVAIVDKFTNFAQTPKADFYPTARYPKGTTASDLTAAHHKKGFSPLAIDPSLLPEKLQKYALSEKLLGKKVFVRGGISPQDAAHLIGVNTPENLFKILEATPSRKEIVANNVKLREQEIADQVNENVDLNHTAIIKAYSNKTKNHIDEMKFLKDKEWPTTRKGIRRIALPLPKIEELEVKAQQTVAKTKVGDLSANQFKVGERKSQRIAVDAILKNEVEKAFVAKEAAATNTQLAKETMIAIGKVNRVFKFARKLDSKENIQELKDAGKLYTDAANEILDVFNLNPSRKNTAEIGSFAKYLEKALANGEAIQEIPDHLLDVRQDAKELTVEQVLTIGDRLKTILHQAKMKNKLYNKFEALKTLQTMEGIAQILDETARKNFDYNLKNLDTIQKDSLTRTEKVGHYLLEAQNALERPQHLLLKLDNDQINGPWNEVIYRPLADAHSAEKNLGIETINHLEKMIEKFGKKEFELMASDIRVIPEFDNIPALRGKATVLQLVKMNMNRGNEGNLIKLEQFGVSRETIQEVLHRELDHRHMEFTQDVWNIFKSFEPKVLELENRTKGVDTVMVKATPVNFTKDGVTKTYPGGYYPIQTVGDEVTIQAEKMLGSTDFNKMENFQQKFYAQAMTEQGHLISRQNGTDILDLDMNRLGHSIAQVIHDLTHRETIRDVGQLLSNKKIRESMVSVLGKQGYRNITDMVIDSSNSVDNKGYNKLDSWAKKTMNYLGSGVSIVDIGGKWTSMVIQPVSTLFAIEKMGPNGAKHMGLTLAKFSSNPMMMKYFYDFAAEIHAPIRDNREDLEGDIVHGMTDLLPTKRGRLSPLGDARDWVKDTAFGALGAVDQFNKVLTVTSAYSQAINGEAAGIAKGDHEAAKTYASNIAELTQTHSNIRNLSPIQKKAWAKPAIMFYNDANNVLNSVISRGRKARGNFNDSYEKAKAGDFTGAAKSAGMGIGTVMKMMLVLSTATFVGNLIRGEKNAFDDVDPADPKAMASAVASFYFGGAVDNILGATPVVRDIDYAVGKYWEKRKNVETPMGKASNDFVTAVAGLTHMLDFSDSAQGVSSKEAKAIFYTAGVLGHFPADAMFKYMGKPDFTQAPSEIAGGIEDLTKSIDKFIKKNKDNEDVSAEYLKQLEDLKIDVNSDQSSNTSAIPDNALPVIKQIESKGKWYAKNPKSSASGLYQFTDDTWQDIKTRAPELGLTDNGRLSSNPEQQEKAMEWMTTESIKSLHAAGVEVTIDSIYAAHFLGAKGAVKVLQAGDNAKLSTLVSAEAMTANNFKSAMKVKDLKSWISNKVLKAEMDIEDQVAKN